MNCCRRYKNITCQLAMAFKHYIYFYKIHSVKYSPFSAVTKGIKDMNITYAPMESHLEIKILLCDKDKLQKNPD